MLHIPAHKYVGANAPAQSPAREDDIDLTNAIVTRPGESLVATVSAARSGKPFDIFVQVASLPEKNPELPADVQPAAWEEVCHRKQGFLWIDHQTLRDTSRWGNAKRARPYTVTHYYRGRVLASNVVTRRASLAAAIAAARKYVRDCQAIGS